MYINDLNLCLCLWLSFTSFFQVFEGYPEYIDQESVGASALLTEEEKASKVVYLVLNQLKLYLAQTILCKKFVKWKWKLDPV